MSETIRAFPTPTKHALERFWSKVNKTETCWEWTAGLLENGYGAFHYNQKQIRAHRFSWLIHNNQDIPKGLMVLHSCDNRKCVNPIHLRIGTIEDNTKDKLDRNRQCKGETMGSVKLSNIEVLQILNDVRGARPIAKQYGVARSLIQKIRQNKLWKHLQRV